MQTKKLCFILDAPFNFLGGTTIYIKNFIRYLETSKKSFEVTIIYPGKTNKTYKKNKINYIEIKTKGIFPLNIINYTKKVAKYLENNSFNYINSQAMAGNYLRYFKPKNAYLTNTYHGVAYYFYKIHLKEKKNLKKVGALYYLIFGKYLEKPPIKKAEKIIGVSEHVLKELKRLYGKPNSEELIRSSVDTSLFKKRDKTSLFEELKLDKNKIYGLYVGRGGFFRKGLDRAIKISKEIIKLNPEFKLIIIGPSKNKENLKLIDKSKNNFIYTPIAKRDLLAKYYSIVDIFFCFSRYEGGAPILTLGEAMASGTIPVCSHDANQEIIENNKNGLIINNFENKEAERILKVLKNKKLRENIIKNNLKKINEFSIEKWGKEYLKAIIK